MARTRTAQYVCGGCGNESEGIWPWPEPGDEQDQEEAPVAEQECPCGHKQLAEFPGYSFFGEAG